MDTNKIAPKPDKPIPFPKGWNKTKLKTAMVGLAHGCRIQHTGWPCGTCFAVPASLNLPVPSWHLVLAMRGDYADGWLESGDYQCCVGIDWNPDGTFKAHRYGVYTRQSMIDALAILTEFLDTAERLKQNGEL